MTVHAHLTALPGLLAEADLAEAHVEARDRRTGALVAYSFVTIHRALALHVAEAVRVGLARLDLEAGRDESDTTPESARGPGAEATVARSSPGPVPLTAARMRKRNERHGAVGATRPVSGSRRATPRLAIVVQGGAVQGVYAERCGTLTVYLLDYDDLRADGDLAEEVDETGELPQVLVEAGLGRVVAEYRAVATRQARLDGRRPADARDAVPGLSG